MKVEIGNQYRCVARNSERKITHRFTVVAPTQIKAHVIANAWIAYQTADSDVSIMDIKRTRTDNYVTIIEAQNGGELNG